MKILNSIYIWFFFVIIWILREAWLFSNMSNYKFMWIRQLANNINLSIIEFFIKKLLIVAEKIEENFIWDIPFLSTNHELYISIFLFYFLFSVIISIFLGLFYTKKDKIFFVIICISIYFLILLNIS